MAGTGTKIQRLVAAFRKTLANPEVQARLADTWWLLSQLKIRTKKGPLVYLEVTEEQRQIVLEWESGQDLTLAKARQIGATTIISALLFIEWLRADCPLLIMQLAHKDDVAREILKMHRVFLESLPPALRPPLTGDSKTELVRADNGARIAVGTARGDGGLRSLTVHRLHITEFAFCADTRELRAASLSAVPDHPHGRTIIESTANFRGDALHQEFTAECPPHVTRMFLSWAEHAEYVAPVPSDFERTSEEAAMAEAHGLSDEQLQWRRVRMLQLKDAALFRREYPLTLEDAYSGFSGQWMDMSKGACRRVPVDLVGGPSVLRHPEVGHRYVLVADCSAAVGADPQAALVLDVDTLEPALVFADPRCSSQNFAELLVSWSHRYWKAQIVVERNFWSKDVLDILENLRAPLWRKSVEDEPGWVTSDATRRHSLQVLRRNIEGYRISTMDSISYDLLSGAKVGENGKVEFPRIEISGIRHHGDLPMCWAIGCAVSETFATVVKSTQGKSPVDKWVDQRRAQKIRNGIPTRAY